VWVYLSCTAYRSVLMGGGYFLAAKGCDDYANTHVLLAASSVCGGNWDHQQNGQFLGILHSAVGLLVPCVKTPALHVCSTCTMTDEMLTLQVHEILVSGEVKYRAKLK